MIVEIIQESWFWAMMQFIVVSLTLLLIYLQVRVQTASHVVQTLSTIHTRWNSEPMIRARNKVCTNWLADNRKFDGVAEYVAEFLEELGAYVEMKAIPHKAIWECQSWYIEHYYCMFRSGIEQARLIHRDKNLYTQFETLYERMNDINRKYGSPALDHEETDINRFATTEMQLTLAFLQLKQEERASLSVQEHLNKTAK